MKRLAFLLLAALPLWGCGAPADPGNRAGHAAAAADDSRSAEAGERSSGAPEKGDAPRGGEAPIRGDGVAGRASGPADPEEADRCGASRHQYLVGQPRSAIPAGPAGATWRVTCTSCPITMDYSPARLNIFYDEETQIVEEVRCG